MDKPCYFNYIESSATFHGAMQNIMGTRFDIVMLGKNREQSERIFTALRLELQRLNFLLNRFDVESEISRLNRRASSGFVPLSPEIWTIMCDCKQYHERTKGLFDVTKDDFSKLLFRESDHSVSFASAGIAVDLGGYAKGYALLRLQKILADNNVGQCFVDFGNSSILGIGRHPFGDSWKVSMENPYRLEKAVFEVDLFDRALSVSGNKPGYSGHIINPLTKKAEDERKAVCVVCQNPLDAEVLTTTLMIAGKKEKNDILKHFEIDKVYEYKL
ncbi:MAG: FAD:protein FMN transferase [Dysgonamonadaceae bacterium]|jgi:thiamine biosynthesis lipoprotein|nr:FAD:protein FMN transferase [Dysgonamonadaceae bacterium]